MGMRCLQEMLLQSGDDGFATTQIVLFPAWPCQWDVSFKLWGPLATSVDVVYAGGKLVSMVVDPPPAPAPSSGPSAWPRSFLALGVLSQ